MGNNGHKLSSKEKAERRKKQRSDWYWRNRDKELAKQKKWREENREHQVQRVRLWRLKNPTRMQLLRRRYWKKLRGQVLEAYGAWCHCFKETREEFLATDHLDDSKPKMVGTALYTWLRQNDFPEGFQILCHNCNQAKAWYGYCPHWNEESTEQG